MAFLVSNASAYGKKDEPIAGALAEDHGVVVIRLSNAGPKIPAAEIARMFRPLQGGSQAASASSRTNWGLGLFIVDQIARAHGGGIRCESQGGQTVFELKLPKGLQQILQT